MAAVVGEFLRINELMVAGFAEIVLFPIALFSIFLYTLAMAMGAREGYGFRHISILSYLAPLPLYLTQHTFWITT